MRQRKSGNTGQTIPRDKLAALRDAFMELVKANRQTGCLEWQGRLHPSGYARVFFDGRPWTATRVAWLVLTDAPLPLHARLWKRPECSVRCVAPWHRVAKRPPQREVHEPAQTLITMPPPAPKPPKPARRPPLATVARRLFVSISETPAPWAAKKP
jgi:hypothetical protein